MAAAITKSGDQAVEVGRVFAQGGIDGLVLYALILATFLMFIVAISAVIIGYRAAERKAKINAEAFAKKDQLNNDQTKMFVESLDRVAGTISALSVSIAGDLQERAATAAVLARMEGTDNDLRHLLTKLNNVP